MRSETGQQVSLMGVALTLVLVSGLVLGPPAAASDDIEEAILQDDCESIVNPIVGGSYWHDYDRLRADPNCGEPPLTVFFDFGYSYISSVFYWEATIRRVRSSGVSAFAQPWFPDGINYIEEWGFGYPLLIHTFDMPGYYWVELVLYGERINRSGKAGEDEIFIPFVSKGGYYVLDRESVIVYVGRSSNSRQPQPHLQSIYDYGWPVVELGSTASGDGPWDVLYQADCSIPSEYIKAVSWDLNADGVFSLSTGRNLAMNRHLTRTGTYTISVRVTDIRDYSAEATATFTLGSCSD